MPRSCVIDTLACPDALLLFSSLILLLLISFFRTDTTLMAVRYEIYDLGCVHIIDTTLALNLLIINFETAAIFFMVLVCFDQSCRRNPVEFSYVSRLITIEFSSLMLSNFLALPLMQFWNRVISCISMCYV